MFLWHAPLGPAPVADRSAAAACRLAYRRDEEAAYGAAGSYGKLLRRQLVTANSQDTRAVLLWDFSRARTGGIRRTDSDMGDTCRT